ncbi:hypothetical protein HMPREF3038_01250 [Akkermansia sp. KLE1797]|nr:hypothetical protein HMPREF3038_01250 [Akkermansia sp. KLE1797]KXU52842.1 hypothetical protein HMPREF3039_03008 [Akkermansia sp. KLE1798]KZA04197.1 hypothetical protein HMPREF1326_02120 [Akkermansia sp. KLE1605]
MKAEKSVRQKQDTLAPDTGTVTPGKQGFPEVSFHKRLWEYTFGHCFPRSLYHS